VHGLARGSDYGEGHCSQKISVLPLTKKFLASYPKGIQSTYLRGFKVFAE
jgi:hypothetical protein